MRTSAASRVAVPSVRRRRAALSCSLASALLAVGATVASSAGFERDLAAIDAVVAKGPFGPSWSSLEKFQVPAWYADGKFGIFIHWGLYSVPAFGNEWYPRNMYLPDKKEFAHHIATYGPQSRFGYKDFIPLFQAERFDPDAWAELFRKAGARFVVPVAEHHDGFPMYDTRYSDWSAAKMGPKRDLIGDLATAVRRQGLVAGLSSHRAEHWWFFDAGMRFDSDVRDPKSAGLYGPARDQKKAESQQEPPDQAFLEDWLLRTCELVDKYQPQLVWFDWWIAQPAFHPYLQRFAAYYYNRGAEWNRGVAINYKKHGGSSFPDTAGVLDIERGQLAAIRPLFWQNDTSISRSSWGYVREQDYKTADSIVDDLVDIVSKNGALLLNIGPKPDGTIPEREQEILLEIGQWLAVNGEAIYGTRPWKTFGEGPTVVTEGSFSDTKRKPFTGEDIRFTTKGDTLYAIVLADPGETLTIKSLAPAAKLATGTVTEVSLLGHAGALKHSQETAGLVVRLPSPRPGKHAFALRIEGLR
jgi:alpha-L-fucosidase